MPTRAAIARSSPALSDLIGPCPAGDSRSSLARHAPPRSGCRLDGLAPAARSAKSSGMRHWSASIRSTMPARRSASSRRTWLRTQESVPSPGTRTAPRRECRKANGRDRLGPQACGPDDCSEPERGPRPRRPPRRMYPEPVRDAVIALWEASDRICGKRLKAMIPTLLPALERHERLKLDEHDRGLLLAISAATIDRLSSEARMVARGGRRRRAGFSSAVRREMPVRTFNDWNDPPPSFCEVDLVAHCGTSVTGAFLQTPMRVDIATGRTECFPLLVRESGLASNLHGQQVSASVKTCPAMTMERPTPRPRASRAAGRS